MSKTKKVVKNIDEIRKLKVAIIHDWGYQIRGGEKVVKEIAEVFPQAEAYILFGDTDLLRDYWKIPVHQNLLGKFFDKTPEFIKSKKIYRYSYFIWPFFIEKFDIHKYDAVITSSSTVAHGVISPYNTFHLSYIHSPMRYAWDQSSIYFKDFSLWKRLVIAFLLPLLRVWDYVASARSDYLLANSEIVFDRIRKYWRKEGNLEILYPPVQTSMFTSAKEREDYYVSVAPFEPNKRADIISELFYRTGKKVKFIGNGSTFDKVRNQYKDNSNMEFLGSISNDELVQVLSKAKGAVFAGIEDFGIAVIDCMSAGNPVFGYSIGGVGCTIKKNKGSGIVYETEDVDKIISDFNKFDEMIDKGEFDRERISRMADAYSSENFRSKFVEIFIREYNNFVINLQSNTKDE